jgi:RNA polymerase sigma-70 factor (ECF subfamily)
VDEQEQRRRFEELIMPHLDAAYNLARWLTRNDHDAKDVVQEAFLRAFRFFAGFHGANSRGWLLSIVRNTSYTWLAKHRKDELNTSFDEQLHRPEADGEEAPAPGLKELDHYLVRQAIEELPLEFREVLILRELEGMSYKQIAELTRVPIGTVMSRLARARKQLQTCLAIRVKRSLV